MIWKNLVHLLLLISISVCSARHKRHHRHHHKRHRHPRAEETELEFDTGVGRRNGLLGREHPEILGVPADPSDLPEAEPLLPGHTLLRPTLGMLRSAMTYPHVDKDNNVYGNAANLGITQTGGRIKYSSSFRKNNDVLQTLAEWVKNIQQSIGDDSGRVEAKPKLLLDHDGGADDAMAIFIALLSEKYLNGPNVILTTTHGNVDEPQSYINTQRILNVAKRFDISIYRGTNHSLVIDQPSDHFFGYDGLGDNTVEPYKHIPAQPEHAALAMIDLAKKYPGQLTVVALGAITNVALAIKLDTKFLTRLSQLYIVSGHIYSERFPNPEFNAQMDPEAYHIVTENASTDKVTIIPFSQTLLSMNITKEWRKDALGSIPTEIMRAQNSYERLSLQTTKVAHWSILDPQALAIVLDPKHIVEEITYSHNGIHLCGEDRGVNTNRLTSNPEEANSRIIYRVREEEYKRYLLKVFTAEIDMENRKRSP